MNNIHYESKLWAFNNSVVAGVDEVGRGCFAGPLVATAVVWPKEILLWKSTDPEKYKLLIQINDSKKLTEQKRTELSGFIKDNCEHYSIIEMSPKEIDENGVGQANKNALRTAVLEINKIQPVDHVLVDHFSIFDGDTDTIPETPITKGDSRSISISAASIVAKVYRDKLMRGKYHKLYPQYGFDTNVGYGTKKHREAIEKYGLCPIHRESFRLK